MKFRSLALLAMALMASLSLATASSDYDSILLRNVSLVDSQNPDKKRQVNILIKNDVLDIVSEDRIAITEAEVSFDARDGVVLGQLVLGQPASFMVMDGNPHENIDVLLDTKSYTLFAISQGEILRNRLEIVTFASHGEEHRSEQDWLAYSTPPLALPLDYRDSRKFNRFETEYVSGLIATALLLDRVNWFNQSSKSEAQVGDLRDFDGGEIRALRLGGVGTLNFEKPWVWTFFGATHTFDKGFDVRESDEFTVFDARLDIPLWENVSFSIGKQKEPISMERIMQLVYLPMQERSAVADAILPSRNVGLVMSGTVLNESVVLAGGAFNNWLDKNQPGSFGDNANNFVGRATWVPFEDESQSTLLHLGLGYRYSDAKEGLFLRAKPEIDQSPDFIGSETFEADRYDTYQLEASLRSGRLWLHGEWMRSDADSEEFGDPTVEGYHVTASWSLTGEMREYNKRSGVFRSLPISRTVRQNGWGAWEVAVRYSTLDANDSLLEAGEMDIWSAGLNWWLTPLLHVGVDYRYITLDKGGLDGVSHGINTRVLVALE